jgi:hypothetical protein
VAAQLQDFAKTALMPAPEQTALLQRRLGHLVRLYRDLQESIGGLDRELAYWLARTPGALLTSISGIGVTLAAGWMAELGPPNQWRALRRMSAYAGVVPRTKQSGGPDKAPQTGHVQQRCNKRFKNVVLLAVGKVQQFGPEDLRRDAEKLQAQGSHTEFGLAKRLVRIAKYLVSTGTIYRPKALMDPNTPKEKLALYYQDAWEKLLPKWKSKADLKDVFAPEHPLGQWRQMVTELYALELPLPNQRAARKTGASAPSGATPARWSTGLGRGRPDWFVLRSPRCLATGIVGSGSEYQQDGSRPLHKSYSHPFTGIWPEAAQRYFHPLSQACSGKYRRRLSA